MQEKIRVFLSSSTTRLLKFTGRSIRGEILVPQQIWQDRAICDGRLFVTPTTIVFWKAGRPLRFSLKSTRVAIRCKIWSSAGNDKMCLRRVCPVPNLSSYSSAYKAGSHKMSRCQVFTFFVFYNFLR